jgi:hypothetical protein
MVNNLRNFKFGSRFFLWLCIILLILLIYTIRRQQIHIDTLTWELVAHENGKLLPLNDTIVVEYPSTFSEWIQINIMYMRNKAVKDPLIIPVAEVKKDSLVDTFGGERPGMRKHEAIDIFAPRGAPVLSAIQGILLFRGRDYLGGNVIKIFGNDHRIYYYAHLMSSVQLELGDVIRQGEIIGFVGNTGNAMTTPPHLHFEIVEIEWLLPLITNNINPYNELR